MKRRFWALAAVLLLCPLSLQQLHSKDQVVEPLTLADLRSRPVVGDLGVPLGTVVEIVATVFDGDELQMKAFADRYLLRITTVDSKQLAKPLTLDFFLHRGGRPIGLARDTSELLEQKRLENGKELNEEQIRRLEDGYVGKTVRLLAYESGMYNGIPRGVPGEMIWQDRDWGFRTTLYVLSEFPVQKPD